MPSDERILIVDDEPLVSDIIAKCLEAEDYDCDIADSAETALESLKHSKYALVVSDINMPGKSGIELLSIIKEQYPDIKRCALRSSQCFYLNVKSWNIICLNKLN